MQKIIFIIIVSAILVSLVLTTFLAQKINQPPARALYWQIESIDTMKYSRDPSRDPDIYQKIPFFVKAVADLHPTHIAIATPYNEEFYPVLKAWVDEARADNLKVWFRGNFSQWEGWFGYPRFNDINQHTILTKAFILKHPELFQDGDIFTPVPEPENGGIGDPRGSDEKNAIFNKFLISSYVNCVNSFKQIGKSVSCGYFSMNGDIAKNVLTLQTVKETGNIVVIDHYVNSPEKMASDIEYLYRKFDGAKIVLGEYGAPIPDINGNMTENEQAQFVDSLLQQFVLHRDMLGGVNYWVIAGGLTALLNEDNSPRKVAAVVKAYYNPSAVKGRITDELGGPLGDAVVQNESLNTAISDAHGNFILFVLPGNITLGVNKKGYKSESITIKVNPSENKILQDIKIAPENVDFPYRTRLFIKNLFDSRFSISL